MSIHRIFVEKKEGFDLHAKKTQEDIRSILGITASVRYLIRYDIEGLSEEELKITAGTVFSEPPVDRLYYEQPPALSGCHLILIEYLPGQYDQRADSAAQCVQIYTLKERPPIRCAVLYAVKDCSLADADKIAAYLINPVESRRASMDKPATLKQTYAVPGQPPTVSGFIRLEKDALDAFHQKSGFAMSREDLEFVQQYFREKQRDPTETELKVIDTYWSDHCRHTTFLTEIVRMDIDADNPRIAQSLQTYRKLFEKHHSGRTDKYPCLMDIATIGARELKSRGELPMLDESEEINACSIRVKAKINGALADWLVMFKNETHNHPTEIEPFGGAATCLGGAIRDPLSGRVYVYHAMRVSGAGDINEPFDRTLKGKLPQRVISKAAASGFSSYGNQIGLATGLVQEFYHPGFRAKRLETGFVVGAAPAENVVRSQPDPGDLILLIGGETGRDGCGGATGSSKAHDSSSIETCGAEVQKGNPITERKIQRLFRNPAFSRRIKRSNDFGAGGVSVAIGELADGIDIRLDSIPKKYMGLTATELAISESQERMAVVVRPEDLTRLQSLCAEENIAVTHVATVTDAYKVVMWYDGQKAVDLDRSFLSTNGVRQTAAVNIRQKKHDYFSSRRDTVEKQPGCCKEKLLTLLRDPAVCSQKGLIEQFDSTIGAGTILMPLGGKHQLSPSIAMAALLPANGAETATVAAYGYNPQLFSVDPYLGAVYAVLESVIKVVLTGADYGSVHLTFQEYFQKLCKDPERWGEPAAALLGALDAQLQLGIAAIGGKDSMSGTFEQISVPPTLISFALGLSDARHIVPAVLQDQERIVYRYMLKRDEYGMPDIGALKEFLQTVSRLVQSDAVGFATVVTQGGAAAALVTACLGNGLGFDFESTAPDLFLPLLGDILLSFKADASACIRLYDLQRVGKTNAGGIFAFAGEQISQKEAREAYTATFEAVYPTCAPAEGVAGLQTKDYKNIIVAKHRIAKPKVWIPVFPGTNCEYDTARKFQEAGAEVQTFVLKNLTSKDLNESLEVMRRQIASSQLIAFPGGFSSGDEPDGSGKFIAATFRNPKLTDALHELLQVRDGLILGICNGFQALIKLGLLPGGGIAPMNGHSPTLTFNNIARHVSAISYIKVTSNLSPWLSATRPGEVYAVPVSHGEGKFIADADCIDRLERSGQIATVYADADGNPAMQTPFNPNGSVQGIEGITSPEGRIFGKMGHAERTGRHLYKNLSHTFDMRLFESGIKYYR